MERIEREKRLEEMRQEQERLAAENQLKLEAERAEREKRMEEARLAA